VSRSVKTTTPKNHRAHFDFNWAEAESGIYYADGHLWLDEFAGFPAYGMRHRKDAIIEAGIRSWEERRWVEPGELG